ncbi:MAG TPA: type II toxin-antitoxin system PrlF family antitoxin [Candidatus Omnitrophota bacterium]|nr:type II toxin-antitoxin system PrlF family antitoxin [Candidatus Omnitrophota bacterium]
MTVLEIAAKITERGQTTIPSPFRRMLGVLKQGEIVFRADERGVITIAPAPPRLEHDPALAGFLDLLERDIGANPVAMKPLTADTRDRVAALTDGVTCDLDVPLAEDDA